MPKATLSDILDKMDAGEFEIRDSAYKHGINESDIRHALRNPLAARWGNHDMYLLIGAASDGSVLEIGFGTTGAIVHAMKARAKYWP
ncbi:hypothetical protein F4555_001516 [Mobiluncus mulieris]|uniref:Uncharacterized protein n=2 Tax=Mobiluncus mulieris TaxID=2052 RepID=A0A8G2HU46_9ACTO|nr:hypothetical protein [Mobiluncus mulieris]MBB5846720.1 hypothetical protein [Mobiluncus mulieris]MCV0011861.1 hypothetical protein [Mobiluncus mulieris]STO16809.1 Uncharacterised protein [Mobiluncus mulieris]